MHLISALNWGDTLIGLWESTGIYTALFAGDGWKNLLMVLLSFVLFYLAIAKKFEPLLLVPIAFGMLLINIPGGAEQLYNETEHTGLLYFLSLGVTNVIYPPLIFLGIGAMTDFGPLIANPKSLLIGGAAQLGVFLTFAVACLFLDPKYAAAVGMIGGADGPTAIYVSESLGQNTAIIAVAAYSYMALIPIIQPPFMKLLTTKKERQIRMTQLRKVSKKEKIIFPIAVTFLCGIILPSALPLLGMLMLGNLLKECMVTDRLKDTASNAMMNIITIILGVCVGAKAKGVSFLTLESLAVVGGGLVAFIVGTCGGVLSVKILNLFSKNKMNPLIGSAGVSAVPMAARVSQKVGQDEVPDNYLLMHAMGPNVAGVIASSIAAGVLLAIFA
ncbi:MAG: sodium ion-translocating decarboxylase subunit beta [Clostridia bacterium]|nr:sodium ion-translocating decarboxylase subunit beta [Clostridia bacterium]